MQNGIEITLDKVRHMWFSGNSLGWLQEELQPPGTNFSEWWAGFIKRFQYESIGSDGEPLTLLTNPGPHVLRYILWACLRTEDPKITPDWCGEWITPERNGELLEKCVSAINAYYPKRPLSPEADSEAANTGASADSTSASASATPAA